MLGATRSTNEDAQRRMFAWKSVLLSIAATCAIASCETLKKGEKEQEAIAKLVLESSFAPKQLHGRRHTYYSRPEAETLISQHVKEDPPTAILVLSGAKCVGKSSVLDHVLAQNVVVDRKGKGLKVSEPRKGVIVVNLDKAGVLSIDKRIVIALGADPEQVRNHRDFVIRVCNRFFEEHRYRPVIVLRATTDLSGPHSLTVSSALSTYSRSAHAAVAVFDPLTNKTVISMLQEWRAFFVAVPELTEEQVSDYLGADKVAELARQGVTLAEVMSIVGGNPILLDDLAGSEDPKRHLQMLVDEATVDLQAYLQRYPTHRAALVALSARPYEQGLSLKDYNATAKVAVRVLDLAEFSGESLQYSADQQSVVFSSRAHHVAAPLALRKK